jgi:hypothetical protein
MDIQMLNTDLGVSALAFQGSGLQFVTKPAAGWNV